MKGKADISTLCAMISAISVMACGGQIDQQAAPPSKVDNGIAESQLTTVTISSEAFSRLRIETALVESTTVAPTRTVGGEIVIPPGQTLVVTAPMAGTVLPPESGGIPGGGTRVARRQPLMRLVALPSDRDLLHTQEALTVAEARLRQARAEADRVANLFADRLVAARDHERAQADLSASAAAYEAALAQQNLILKGMPADPRGLAPLLISSPGAGVVRSLSVGAGQSVAAGAPLAEIIRLDRLWVRVPLYVSDAHLIARSADANVHAIGDAGGGTSTMARPIAAPPSADANAASVDLYYELPGASRAYQPGERVGITLTLLDRSEKLLIVPLESVLHDMNGGAWVYELTDSLQFTRRRVELVRVANGRAIIARGLTVGASVVTAGAAELFGTEFGAGK